MRHANTKFIPIIAATCLTALESGCVTNFAVECSPTAQGTLHCQASGDTTPPKPTTPSVH